MTNDIQNLLQHIGQLALASVPTDEWDTTTIVVKALVTYVEQDVAYVHQEKQFVPETFLIEDDELEYDEQATPSFERLRQLMYDEAPFRGAWYTASMIITKDGKFNTEFDYDNKPELEYESGDDEYARDFQHFPRNEASTPEWLKEIVRKHGLVYHEPAPLA